MTEYNTWHYSVFLHNPASPSPSPSASASGLPTSLPPNPQPSDLGPHIGSINLRRTPGPANSAPLLPPPRSFEGAPEVGTGAELTQEEVEKRVREWEGVELKVRVLGYALFAGFEGRGYGTEGCRALIEGYKGAVGEFRTRVGGEKEGGKEVVFYIEAGVDVDNPASQGVLRKLGFRTVGMKVEKEKAWLNGGWKGPGWWITGLYL